ncbi:MAG: farnesyl diphosphate synthase [Pseudomonadota bacterium]
MSPEFLKCMSQWQQRVDARLVACLKQKGAPDILQQAMRYSVLNGGKRLRPMLSYAAAEAVSGDHTCADIAGCAVEFIHAYSLIHDDLPAMDDDVLRRGRPTCHIAFDEATAILAGDALQALAFECLAASPHLAVGHAIRLQMVLELSRACGPQGMVGGQAIDIAATGKRLSETELSDMHSLKTGALITASVVLGALSTNVATPTQLTQLRQFAGLLGLAFQIQDDILDVEAESEVSGKQQGKDAKHNKPTYPSILGLEGARSRLVKTFEEALQILANFSGNTTSLQQLAHYVINRKS